MVTKRVVWDDAEWDKVCAELAHMHPEVMKQKDFVNSLTADDVANAMHNSLSANRWRKSMNMAHIRPKLKERFAAMEKTTTKKSIPGFEGINIPDQGVLEPLIEMLAARLFERMKPMLDEYLLLKDSSGKQIQEQPQAAVQGHHREGISSKIPKKKRIGVIGLLPIQAHEVARTFPNLNFTFVEDSDKSKQILDKFSNLDAVFVLASKSNHNAANVLRGTPVWNRGQFKNVVGGGTSAVKRTIQAWLDSQKA